MNFIKTKYKHRKQIGYAVVTLIGLLVIYVSFCINRYSSIRYNFTYFCKIMSLLLVSIATSYGAFYGGRYLKNLRISNHDYDKIKRSGDLINTFFSKIHPVIMSFHNAELKNKSKYYMGYYRMAYLNYLASRDNNYRHIRNAVAHGDYNIMSNINIYNSYIQSAINRTAFSEIVSRKSFRDFLDKSQKWVSITNAEIINNELDKDMIVTTIKTPFINFMKDYGNILIHKKLKKRYINFFNLESNLKKL